MVNFGDIEGKFLNFPLPVLPVWLCRRQSAKASKTFAAGNTGAGGMYTSNWPLRLLTSWYIALMHPSLAERPFLLLALAFFKTCMLNQNDHH